MSFGTDLHVDASLSMRRLRDVLMCGTARVGDSNTASGADDGRVSERERMVDEQMATRDITDPRVLAALRKVPRHRFVIESEQRYAYYDTPLPIGAGQTISQPYVVALMTQLARPTAHARVLEVGTGSGYQSAVLAELVAHVYTVELEPTLSDLAQQRFCELGYRNITACSGDGYAGWGEHAPFDIVIVTAAPDHAPPPLLEQLQAGGRMVVPIGAPSATQFLQLIEKNVRGQLRTHTASAVRFVPLRRTAVE